MPNNGNEPIDLNTVKNRARVRVVTLNDTSPPTYTCAQILSDGSERLCIDASMAPIWSFSKSLMHVYIQTMGWIDDEPPN